MKWELGGSDGESKSVGDSDHQKSNSHPEVIQSVEEVNQPTGPEPQFCELYLPAQKRKLRQLGFSCTQNDPTPLNELNTAPRTQHFAIRCDDDQSPPAPAYINFNVDTILIPLEILNLPQSVHIEDLDRIQRLCIVSDEKLDLTPQAHARLRTVRSLVEPLMLEFDHASPRPPRAVIGINRRFPGNAERQFGISFKDRINQPDIYISDVRFVTVQREVTAFKKRLKFKVRSAFDSFHRHVLDRRAGSWYLS